MKTLILIITTMVFMSCTDSKPASHKREVTKMKYCMKECIRDTFSMFHNEGDSWGTGSSSMSGLSQSGIIDRVEKQCQEMLEGEECCKGYESLGSVDYGFSNGFGTCKDG